MTWVYLLINCAIIAGPLYLTRAPGVRFQSRFAALAWSIALVSSAYITWDVIVTAWGEWSFNSDYVSGIKVINLPVEEMLFFVTVPYACLFIWEVVLNACKPGTLPLPVALQWIVIAMLAIGSVLFSHQGYTAKALASCALFLLFARIIEPALLISRQYWLWLGICLVPFFIINSALTAIPVVLYNSAAIWGVRIVTIPAEDFFYNFSLLSFYLLVYRRFRR